MRLNVNRVLHTPDAGENFHFEMDLSDLEFGGEKPVINPVVVDGQVRNKAGVLLLELQTSTTLRCRCSRCLESFDLDDLARTAFILDMDTVFLCSPQCKGLCPGCGVNLNREACRCKKQVDPRLAALAKLLPREEA